MAVVVEALLQLYVKEGVPPVTVDDMLPSEMPQAGLLRMLVDTENPKQGQFVLKLTPASLLFAQFTFDHATSSTCMHTRRGLFLASKLEKLELFPFFTFNFVN